MGLLRESGYITIDKDGLIDLTPLGLEVAGRIYERHQQQPAEVTFGEAPFVGAGTAGRGPVQRLVGCGVGAHGVSGVADGGRLRPPAVP